MKLTESLTNKILAIDLGERFIGCAISDEQHILASPLPAIEVAEGPTVAMVRKLIKQHRPKKIVVGLPYHADGTASNQTKKYQYFIKKLIKHLASRDSPTIEAIDETLSSWETRKRYKKLNLKKSTHQDDKLNIDSFVAMDLLNQYLKIDLHP